MTSERSPMFSRSIDRAGITALELLISSMMGLMVIGATVSFLVSAKRDSLREQNLRDAEIDFETVSEKLKNQLSAPVPGSFSLAQCESNGYCRSLQFQSTFRSSTPQSIRITTACIRGTPSLRAAGLKAPTCFRRMCNGMLQTTIRIGSKSFVYPERGSSTVGMSLCMSAFEKDIHFNIQSFYKSSSAKSNQILTAGRVFSVSSYNPMLNVAGYIK